MVLVFLYPPTSMFFLRLLASLTRVLFGGFLNWVCVCCGKVKWVNEVYSFPVLDYFFYITCRIKNVSVLHTPIHCLPMLIGTYVSYMLWCMFFVVFVAFAEVCLCCCRLGWLRCYAWFKNVLQNVLLEIIIV